MNIATKAVPGTQGIDCNYVLHDKDIKAFQAKGYLFAVRYVPRITMDAADLTKGEVDRILAAGMAVMPVQHVESSTSWEPEATKGITYGTNAAKYSRECGIPDGTTVWCDLEGVSATAKQRDIFQFGEMWAREVQKAGFQAGLYVGYNARLSPSQLYALPFTRYWAAYNVYPGQYPAFRGICMKQQVAPKEANGLYDVNTILVDEKGDVPMWAIDD